MPANVQQILLSYGGSAPDAIIAFLQATQIGTDLTTYTFSGQNFGTANTARYIIVSISGRAAAARTISSVTIGGVSASAVVSNPSADGTNRAAIYVAAVPTGTSGDVVITWSAGMVRCQIGLYSALNINPTAESMGTSTADPLTSNLAASAGSVQVAIGHTDGTATATWSGTNGLTEDFDAQLGDATGRYSGASRASAAAVTSTATCTWTSSTRPVYVAASFAKA